MRDSHVRILVVVAVAVVLGLWIKSYFSPERVVRRRLLAAVDSFEQEQLLAAMQVVSRSYEDAWGQSYETIAAHLSEMMSTFDDLEVDLLETAVERADDHVRVRLAFVVSGQDGDGAGRLLGSHESPCRTSMVWRDVGQGWRIATTESIEIPELQTELDAMRER